MRHNSQSQRGSAAVSFLIVLYVTSFVVAPSSVMPVTGAATNVDQPQIVETTITENRGDVVQLKIKLPEGSDAVVDIQSRTGDYHAKIQIEDTYDGVVRLRINTFKAGGWGRYTANQSFTAVEENDEVVAFRKSGAQQTPIDAGSYKISVTSGSVPDDTASLKLKPWSIGKLTPGTAPDSLSFETATGISREFSSFSRIGRKDWLILRLNASGLGGYIESAENLSSSLHGATLSIQPTNGGGDIDVTDGRVFANDSNNVFYIIFDTDRLRPDTSYQALFAIEPTNNPLVDSRISRRTEFSIEDRALSFNRPVRIGPAPDQKIRGQATVAPGSAVEIVLSDVNSDFFYRETVRIQPDRTFTASFDLQSVNTGRTRIRVRSIDPGRVASGIILESVPETPTPTVTPPPTPTLTPERTTTGIPVTTVPVSTEATQAPTVDSSSSTTSSPSPEISVTNTAQTTQGANVSPGAVIFVIGIPVALYLINRRF